MITAYRIAALLAGFGMIGSATQVGVPGSTLSLSGSKKIVRTAGSFKVVVWVEVLSGLGKGEASSFWGACGGSVIIRAIHIRAIHASTIDASRLAATIHKQLRNLNRTIYNLRNSTATIS